jgi:hypothetical protein
MSTLFSPKMERQRTGIHPVVLDWNQRNWCRLMVSHTLVGRELDMGTSIVTGSASRDSTTTD